MCSLGSRLTRTMTVASVKARDPKNKLIHHNQPIKYLQRPVQCLRSMAGGFVWDGNLPT